MEPPILVVSPHLDDGVFGCGVALAGRPGSVVLTIFAGRPAATAALTEWDAAAGFAASDDVIGARRAEDAAAVGELGARPVWLDFRDSQYGPSPAVAEIAAALDRAIALTDAPAVFIPLGLFHSDHALAHDAALAVLSRHTDRRWLAYGDSIYRRLPGLVMERLQRLERAGFGPRPTTLSSVPDERRRKLGAVQRYRSQLRALASPGRSGHADTGATEEYWRLGHA